MQVTELLQPLVEAMRQQLLLASYLQADETIVPVQRKGSEALRFTRLKDTMHDGRSSDHRRTCGNTEPLAAKQCSTFN